MNPVRNVFVGTLFGLGHMRCNSRPLAVELHLLCTQLNSLAPGNCGSNLGITISNSLYIIAASLLNHSQVNSTEPHLRDVDIGSGNGLVPNSTKPLSEPMLIKFKLSYSVTGPQ